MSKRTITEADRMEAIYTWLSAAQVARRYFADADNPDETAVSASTIMRWNDDPDHPFHSTGTDFSKPEASKRLVLFRPEDVEAFIEGRVSDAA